MLPFRLHSAISQHRVWTCGYEVWQGEPTNSVCRQRLRQTSGRSPVCTVKSEPSAHTCRHPTKSYQAMLTWLGPQKDSAGGTFHPSDKRSSKHSRCQCRSMLACQWVGSGVGRSSARGATDKCLDLYIIITPRKGPTYGRTAGACFEEAFLQNVRRRKRAEKS